MRQKIYVGMIILSIFWLSIFASCITTTPIILTNTPLISDKGTNYETDSTQPPKIKTPTDVITPTVIAPTLSMTAPTLLPNMSEKEKEGWQINNLANNDTCKLPCFLGIIPGETTWSEVQKNMSIIFGNSITKPYEYKNPENTIALGAGSIFYDEQQAEISNNYTTVYLQNEVVDYIHQYFWSDIYNKDNPQAFTELFKQLSIERVLQRQGRPDHVWILSSDNMTSVYFSYSIYLFYQEDNFLVKYSGSGRKSGKQFKICPKYGFPTDSVEGTIDIYIRAPESSVDIKQEVNFYDYPQLFVEIDKATGMSEEEFYKLLTKDNREVCFMVKSE